MKTRNIIIAVALAGAGAYYAVKKGLFKKKDINTAQTDADIKNQLLWQEQKRKLDSISLENPNSDKAKIARIQSYLGVAIDGILGPQTYNAIVNKIPSLSGVSIAELNQEISTLYEVFASKGWA
jgi:peptidoglycan hydrolase-like protein with peptidoglycan-binding domain